MAHTLEYRRDAARLICCREQLSLVTIASDYWYDARTQLLTTSTRRHERATGGSPPQVARVIQGHYRGPRHRGSRVAAQEGGEPGETARAGSASPPRSGHGCALAGSRAASNNLRLILHVARRTLDPDSQHLIYRDGELLLCPEGPIRVDVDAFEEATVPARRLRAPAATGRPWTCTQGIFCPPTVTKTGPRNAALSITARQPGERGHYEGGSIASRRQRGSQLRRHADLRGRPRRELHLLRQHVPVSEHNVCRDPPGSRILSTPCSVSR